MIISIKPIEKATTVNDIKYRVSLLENGKNFERGYDFIFEGLDDAQSYVNELKNLCDERLIDYIIHLEWT
jgi:hypothetical protein